VLTFLKISAAMGIVELTGLEMMAIMASGHTYRKIQQSKDYMH
jgi:hypothetical protein